MTSAYSKSCRYKKFSVHTNTKSIVFKLFHSGKRFQKVLFAWIFLCGYKRISEDGRRIRNNEVFFSNLSGIVWTGPKYTSKAFKNAKHVLVGPLLSPPPSATHTNFIKVRIFQGNISKATTATQTRSRHFSHIHRFLNFLIPVNFFVS